MTPEQYNALVLAELKATRAATDAINAKLDILIGCGGATAKPASATTASANGQQRTGGAIADDADLAGQYGDPSIRFDPSDKHWKGNASFVGFHFSEVTDPEYLDAMASGLDASAWWLRNDKNEKKDERKAGFKDRDAARARGHAARLRARMASGQASAATGTDGANDFGGDYSGGSDADDGIPF